MASKIDKINVNGTSYDIDLPSTATPSITSLTVTGDLTVSGAANLADISCEEITCEGQIRMLSGSVHDTLTAANVNITNILRPAGLILGGGSAHTIRFATNTSSSSGGLFFTPLSTTTTNRTWVLTNQNDSLTLGIKGSVEAASLTVTGTSRLPNIMCDHIQASGSADNGNINIYPMTSADDPRIVFYDHPNDVETALVQNIQSGQFELHTDNKFLFQENTQKFQFPAIGGTLVTKDDIDLINERLDALGFRGGSAVVTEANGGQPIVTVNSLTKQGKYVLFTLSWTVENLSSGTVRNTTVSIAEPFRPKSEALPNFIITFSCAGGYVGTTRPR